jgi:general secretion pathway protein E
VAATLVGFAISFQRLGAWLGGKAKQLPDVMPLAQASQSALLVEIKKRVQRSIQTAGEDATELLDQVLYGAARLGASDVHLTPTERALVVTLRVDGQIIQLATFTPSLGRLVTNRVKVLALLRLESRAMPQDGRMSRQLADVRLELRVSVLPTESGERVVLRLVPSASAYASLQELGFEPQLVNAFQELLGRPQGLLFVTGPVGNGKSTTLYSSLLHIHETRGQSTALVTLEDPIEQKLAFLTQTPVNQRGGLTFADSLRSVLRQDPNVLMVGEIRDRETAEIATQAGLTGHLILTTVHANDALGAFTRLLELGASGSALASAAVGSVSQRLVRCLCVECRKYTLASESQRSRFGELGIDIPEDAGFYEAVGCLTCAGHGYLGRKPIAELVVADSAVRAAIASGTVTDPSLLERQALAGLARAGLRCAAGGTTSLGEVMRVCA